MRGLLGFFRIGRGCELFFGEILEHLRSSVGFAHQITFAYAFDEIHDFGEAPGGGCEAEIVQACTNQFIF